MDSSKRFKKYIAGFRSGNPANEKKAKIYYGSMILAMLIGSSWTLNDFATLAILLVIPSLYCNCKSMIQKKEGYSGIFIFTLAIFLGALGIFDITYVENTATDNVIESIEQTQSNDDIKESIKEENKEDITQDKDKNEDESEESTVESEGEDKDKVDDKDKDNEPENDKLSVDTVDDNNKIDSNESSNIVIIPSGPAVGDNSGENDNAGSNNPVVNNVTQEAEIHFINTGNSDAVLIKQGDKAALIDGGDNDDEGLVVSYLKSHGVKELEYVFATHPHADHIGGLDAVVNSIAVKNVYVSNGSADTKTYTDFINAMANKGLYPSVPLLNSEFPLGNSKFKILSVANSKDLNNVSLVILYTNGNDKVLLTGDAEQEIERGLNVGKVDLLKAGHHGSKTSSSSSFINMTSPKHVAITVGKNNKYGHPSAETMNTFKNKGIEVHRTDECGHIVFKSTGNGVFTNCTKGSYNAGGNTNSSSNSSISGNSTNSAGVIVDNNTVAGTVYWTPSGKSYHSTNKCITLSRSKTILSGTLSESGKNDPCDRCN